MKEAREMGLAQNKGKEKNSSTTNDIFAISD